MIWATINSWSCFHWLYRASSSLPAKNIMSLILVLIIWWCPRVESYLVLLEKVFSMTSAFSWQNSSLFPASFCTPRPNLPVTPGISWLLTFTFLFFFFFYLMFLVYSKIPSRILYHILFSHHISLDCLAMTVSQAFLVFLWLWQFENWSKIL